VKYRVGLIGWTLRASDQEVEIASLIGLQDSFDVQGGIATCRRRRNRRRYALSISFLTHRLTPENLEHAGAQVITGAREIARKLP
jgi:hypothetical protein